MSNPYDVERSWPDYFLEHRKMTVERQGTYKCGDLPVWTVYCPAGYLGNSTIIEGDDGLIVYDTGVNVEAGAVIAEEITKISDKPIRAIFYSHHHADHYNGTSQLITTEQVAAGEVKIYAWDNFNVELANEFGEILPRQSMGIAYYGGAFLAPEDRHHHGIGTLPAGGTPGFIPPTDLLGGDTELDVAGVKLDVFYTGGEAISEFGIHLPGFDMVMIADEFFTGIPNLHTIRGSKPRLPDNYIGALDRVLELEPEWLLGSHIIPIQGKEKVAASVEKYRDATQYLWDQSIRLINKGYTPVELQHALKDLPELFWDPPYTVPMYGTPITTVPEFFTGWVSWFSGDSTDMLPTEPKVKAERFVELMGGLDAVLDRAKQYHSAGDHQFAAELAQLAVRADPGSEDARLVKAAALRARGYQELNPIVRSWYLTGALELEGAFDPTELLTSMTTMLSGGKTASEIVSNWRYQLDPEKAGTDGLKVGVRDADSGAELTVLLRNGILITSEGIDDDSDVVISATAAGLMAEEITVDVVSGDSAVFDALVGLLDREVVGFKMHQR